MNSKKTVICLVFFSLMIYSRMFAGGTPDVSNSLQQNVSVLRSGGNTSALTTSNKAYGDNMKEVEPGVFAIYSGDVNQDGYIATDDVTTVDNDNLVGAAGNYLINDLNGDTYVGTDDVTLCDNNNLMGISIQRP